MDMEQIIFVTNKNDLRETLLDILNESKTMMPCQEVLRLEENMDRRMAAKFLGVSYQTMYNWTKSGVVIEHGHGRKKFYLRSELINSMISKD